MEIIARFKDRETGAIQTATIWAHRVTLPGIDLPLAIHPRYSLDLEGNVRRSETGEYILTDISTGQAVSVGASVRLALEVFLLRVKHHGLEKIKSSLTSW